MSYRYANNTRVRVSKTIDEIRTLLKRKEAMNLALLDSETEGQQIACVLNGRQLVFSVEPDIDEAERRRRWRVMLMKLKLSFEDEEIGRPFDEAFMPFIMLPDGKMVYEYAVPAIADSYRNRQPALMDMRGETP